MNGKLTPVTRYSDPKYPTKEAVNADPRLLAHIPRRWARNPYVLTALSLVMAAGLTACGNNQDSESLFPAASPAVSASPDSADSAGSAPSEADALDIPIFAHGTGRGSYGCESVAPPVFLSEEEAMQVIAEECAAQGIDISGSKTISGTFPATSTLPEAISGSASDETYTGELTLDGYSETLGIGIEFVSTEDILDWQAPTDVGSSTEQYDLKGTAQRLAEATDNVAVFYDPAAGNYEDFTGSNEESYMENSKEQSMDELREQVRDFLQWLKAQGVI